MRVELEALLTLSNNAAMMDSAHRTLFVHISSSVVASAIVWIFIAIQGANCSLHTVIAGVGEQGEESESTALCAVFLGTFKYLFCSFSLK